MTTHAAFSVRSQNTDNGITVIAISGELDIAAAPLLRHELRTALAGCRTPHILIDLTELTFTDSTGLAVIISGRKRAVARGGMLALAAVPPDTAALLRITGLTQLFPPYATVSEAQAALSREGTACRV